MSRRTYRTEFPADFAVPAVIGEMVAAGVLADTSGAAMIARNQIGLLKLSALALALALAWAVT